MRSPDRFSGCLIGGAAGDALGYAVEFMWEKDIFARYGKNGITEYSPEHGLARISDDTQMTLFTAAGLLLGTERGKAADDPYLVTVVLPVVFHVDIRESDVSDILKEFSDLFVHVAIIP